MNRRDALQSLAGGASAALLPMLASHAQTAGHAPFESLHAIGQRKGMEVGCAIGMKQPGPDDQLFGFSDPAYRVLLARECGAVVHENEMKWKALRPTPDRFDFGNADRIRDWARGEKLALRGHTLLWADPTYFPAWLDAAHLGTQPAQAAARTLRTHIAEVCKHFRDDIFSYDAVNEAVAPDSGNLRSNVFFDAMGGVETTELAFRTAREHAPKAQLVYNDFMSWGPSSAKHRAGVLKLLAELKKRGAPVDALGLQGHIGTSGDGRALDPEGAQEREWRKFLDEATGMGLSLLITEFDVNDRYLSPGHAQRDAEVAAVARAFLDITFSYPQLRSFTFWGMADHLSWLQPRWPRADGQPKRPTPYDAKLQVKPLREAVAQALRAMPMRSAA